MHPLVKTLIKLNADREFVNRSELTFTVLRGTLKVMVAVVSDKGTLYLSTSAPNLEPIECLDFAAWLVKVYGEEAP